MAPSPQETMVEQQEAAKESILRPLTGEEVVISGMSGIFPSSNSVQEFKENIYNKVDMVTTENPRWIFNHPEVPKHLGKVTGMGKFDAQFFRVHFKQACTMEPMSRKLLEHTYSAIFDSGINPLQLRGRKVGVFIGSTFSESEKIVIYENIQRNGFGITGCNKAMYANRISYWIDGKGPSYALDLACASSMACLEHAYRSISTGQCEAAIVGGCNLCMHPNISLNLKRAGFLCLDGKTKAFDKNGDGYVRSDAINVLFLQKAKDAKRIYSEVYHAKGNYSIKLNDQFVPKRDTKEIQGFLEEFYSEINISPKDVEFVEANGSGLADADANELEAIGNVFAKDSSVMVGSVKSNMGHSEPASGTSALTKVCLAYHDGKIPANLHYTEPQDQIASVKEGRVQVVTEHTPFNRGFTALNSFSYSGANIHVLLKGHYKQKELERYNSSLPYLVLASGRQESCVNKVLEILKTQPIDPEQLGLLHSIHESDIPGHMCRGYTIIESNEQNETVCVNQNIDFCSGVTRPLWFVYSGMGSQWAGMGADLMRIPIFAAAVEKCHRVLEPKGIDIVKILTDTDKTIFDNILHSFVGIAAVQIGLTDILKEMGIVPDNIIGHSVGELGCAYADGCFTAEEMILFAYSRGMISQQIQFIRGSMAAVGLGYKAIQALCPPEIEVACHNSSESSTISGPADIMKQFVAELTSRGIFAKEVPCSNIAFHSRYIADAGPGLLKYLSEVIKDPKPRSAKWLSTSVPQDQWDEPKAKYSSAEYHTNNLLNSVLFEETSKLIPANAIVIEVAPHGLLQAILKRSLSECFNLSLTRRGNSEPVKYLLEAIGKLYQAGLNPKIDVLYPKIEFPVSTETPLLAHFVEWEHNEDWPQAKYNSKDRVMATARDFVMSIYDDDYEHFRGHVREGNYVFPEAGLLVLVWETLAMHKGVKYEDLSVEFSDVQFFSEANLKDEVPIRLIIMIHKGNNHFEVTYESSPILTGFINVVAAVDEKPRDLGDLDVGPNDLILSTEDVYKTMRRRGYSYEGVFQSIQSSNIKRNSANIKWTKDWVTLIDSLIQFNGFARDHYGVSTPKLIKKLKINTKIYANTKQMIIDDAVCYNAQIYSLYDTSRCAGVELEGLVFTDKPAIDQEPDVMQTKEFIPHFLSGNIGLKTALHVNMQIVTDNSTDHEIKITTLFSNALPDISNAIQEVSDEIPSHDFIVADVPKSGINQLKDDKQSKLIIVDDLLTDEVKMMQLYTNLSKNSFILAIEQDAAVIHPKYKLFDVVTALTVQKQIFILLKKAEIMDDVNVTYMPITQDNKFSWVPKVQAELQKSRRLVLVSQRQPYCLLGVVRGLRKTYGDKIGLVVVDDFHVPSFNPENNVYKEQLQKCLAFNIMKKGQWGGYYNVPCAKAANFRNVSLTSTVPGDLDTLTWVEAGLTPSSHNLVQVCYAGPSFKDAQNATSDVTTTKTFGMDFSGVNKRGEKVMGLVASGAISSTVEADPNLLWPVPGHWTLEDAATVPLPYVLAYYCMTIRSKMPPNSTVFINGGAGGLGQAIISICLALNCTVYTTVSDEQKKRFLLKMFPSLNEENIGNSRIETFNNMLVNNTKNKRCNVVINCLSGFYRAAAMKCVGFAGFLLDLSDYDTQENNDFGMAYLFEEKSYVKVQLSSIFRPENVDEKKQIQLAIAEGIAKGIVKPLSRVVYSPMDVSRAFRFISSSKHKGKVLLRMRDPVTMAQGLNVTPRMTYSSKGTYIVVCGENELGVEIVDRLVRRGAKKIVINIKPKCIGGYYHTKLAEWEKFNVTVDLSSENLQTEKGCVNLLKEGAKLGPILGIFIVQNFKEDELEESFQPEDVAAKFNETAWIVANLDVKSRNLCTELNHFVVLNSSPKSLIDEYAVSVSEKICQSRNDIGLPGLAFHVPLVNEFNTKLGQSQLKVQPQSISAVFNALETSIKMNYKNVVTFDLKKRNTTDFLVKIARIIGVKHIDDIDNDKCLEDLVQNLTNIEEIKTTIKEVFNVSYSVEKIKKMDIAGLKSLCQDFTKQNTKFKGGLGAFYTYIDKDECMATEPMVPMPTKLSNATENEEELDPKAAYLMLIPGFEGHSQLFVPICERLKVQAMTFQLGPDLTDDSIQQMAANILKFMKKRFELKSKFYLLGYSFGVNVALELAALFEKEGLVGIVYCLDSSPDALRVQLDAYVGNLTDTQLQDTIIEHMYNLMTGGDSKELRQDLDKLENWTDKVEACVSRLRVLVNYSNQFKRSVLQTAYKRIQLARDYEPNFKLESQLVLMKGIPHPEAKKLADDYSLSKYTKQPVEIFNIEADHALAPFDCRVSNIVNKLLEPKLLEEFKKKNLCETYLADQFKFL